MQQVEIDKTSSLYLCCFHRRMFLFQILFSAFQLLSGKAFILTIYCKNKKVPTLCCQRVMCCFPINFSFTYTISYWLYNHLWILNFLSHRKTLQDSMWNSSDRPHCLVSHMLQLEQTGQGFVTVRKSPDTPTVHFRLFLYFQSIATLLHCTW